MDYTTALHQCSEKTSHYRESFLSLAKRRYSSGSRAITALRRLGEPPSSNSGDIIHILSHSSTIQTALEALVVLGDDAKPKLQREQAVLLIKQNWESYVGPWIKFFLEGVVLAKEGSGMDLNFAEKVMFTLPILILYPDTFLTEQRKDMEGDELIRMAPYLLPLCTRVWLKAIRSMHWSWPKWCAILDEVLNVPKYASHFMDIIQELDAGKNIIHFGIRYLNHIAKDIREMDERGLSAFRNLIILFTVCFSTGTFLNVPFLQNGGAAVTVRALRALCSSRKVVKHVSSSSPDFTKLMILTACTTTFLRDSLSGTLGIPDALGAGLLSIMIKAERFHSYEFDHDSPMTSFDLDYTVWSSFVSLLNQISLFVVYPSVLRHIAKAAKSGLAFGPRTVKELQISWEKCKQRALEMQAVYSSVKQTGLLCCFLDCPHQSEPCVEPGIVKYRRCSSCLCVMYCSHNCAKQNWMEHRKNCKALGDSHKAGKQTTPAQSDRMFFWKLIQLMPRIQATRVREKMASFVPPSSSKPSNVTGMERVTNHGILVFEFNTLEKQERLSDSEEEFSIQPANHVISVMRRVFKEEFVSLVNDAAGLEEGEMLVIAFFPGPILGSKGIWPVWDKIDIPGGA